MSGNKCLICRMELQGKRDSVQKEVDDFKLESHRYLTKTNKQIIQGNGLKYSCLCYL